MLAVLEDLASLPKPSSCGFELDQNQREVIVSHISHSNLKATAIITSLSSLFAVSVLVIRGDANAWEMYCLFGCLVLGLILISWILPKKVYYSQEQSWFGIKRKTLLTLAMCLYDGLLGALALGSQYSAKSDS
jgi:hypothetical protein